MKRLDDGGLDNESENKQPIHDYATEGIAINWSMIKAYYERLEIKKRYILLKKDRFTQNETSRQPNACR
ncbi:MAG: hypothetical protein AABW51_03030 [Nanoarchaeota archaeon]